MTFCSRSIFFKSKALRLCLFSLMSFLITSNLRADDTQKILDFDQLDHIVWANNTEELQNLIDQGIDINLQNDYGETVLMRAVKRSQADMVRFLLGHGADIRIRTEYNDGILDNIRFDSTNPTELEAIFETLFLLFENGLDVDDRLRTDRGETLLMAACNDLSAEGIRFLLKNGSNIQAKDNNNCGPLDYLVKGPPHFSRSIKKSLYTELKLLLDAGLSITDDASNFESFLSNLARTGDTKALLYILNREDYKALLDSAISAGIDLPLLANQVLDSLFPYIHGQKADIKQAIGRLLELGADLFPPQDSGNSYLFQTQNPAVILALLDYGLPIDTRDEYGRNLVLYCVDSYEPELANPRFIRELFARGCDINASDRYGKTALMKAEIFDIVDVLIELGADPAAVDGYWNTALHIHASESDDTRILKLLVEKGSKIDARNRSGRTAFLEALRLSNMDNARCLVNLGADALAIDDEGNTGLHLYYSIEFTSYYSPYSFDLENSIDNRIAFFEYMLGLGIKPNALNKSGDSVLLSFLRADPQIKSPLTKALVSVSTEEDNASVRESLNQEWWDTIEYNKEAVTLAITLPLIVGGLSILMREVFYAEKPQENWMASVNSFLTLSIGTGVSFGFIAAGSVVLQGSGFGDAIAVATSGLVGLAIGCVIGGIIGLLPDPRMAFASLPCLYYIPTGISVIASIGIFSAIFE